MLCVVIKKVFKGMKDDDVFVQQQQQLRDLQQGGEGENYIT